jgi:hypothetical protein
VDTLQVTPARYNEFMGLAHVPWDIKAVFGMVSDMWPIAGYRLSPYIISAGVAGIVAYSFLAFGGLAATTAAFMCLLINFAHASPDVMIDGSVAIRMKTHPALASDLQTLCWGSTGLCGIVAALVQGPVVDAYAKPVFLSHFYVHAIFSQDRLGTNIGKALKKDNRSLRWGARPLYALAIVPCGIVIVPAVLGWMREERLPVGERNPKCSVCVDNFKDPVQAPIFKMALQIGKRIYVPTSENTTKRSASSFDLNA